MTCCNLKGGQQGALPTQPHLLLIIFGPRSRFLESSWFCWQPSPIIPCFLLTYPWEALHHDGMSFYKTDGRLGFLRCQVSGELEHLRFCRCGPPKRAEMVFSRSCVYIWVVETCLVCAGSLNLISLQYPKRNRCGHRSGLFPFSFANKFFLRVVLKILFVFLRLLCYPGWPWTHVAESNL